MAYDRIQNHRCTICNDLTVRSVKAKKCTYRVENPNARNLCLTKIDGCYIETRGTGTRCDYLLVDCTPQHAFFIELKGSDFLHAVEQIQSTIDHVQSDLGGYEFSARIVLTKVSVPNLQNNPHVLKLRKRLKNRQGNLKYGTILLTETI